MPQIGPAEILVILLVALLVFGPHKLPEVGRQVGRGMRELRKFQDTIRGEIDGVLNLHDDDEPPAALPESAPAPAGDADGPAAPRPVTSDARPAPRPSGARAPSRFRAPGAPPAA
jgi:sec-independent protein translocase protein TatA